MSENQNNKIPLCIECKSKDVRSNGKERWRCNDCGRQWRKHYRGPFNQASNNDSKNLPYDLNNQRDFDYTRIIKI